MLFLAGADHERYGKVKWTRQINLQSATVSLQVVISLCKRKETAALKFKAAVSYRRVDGTAVRRLFFFCLHTVEFPNFYMIAFCIFIPLGAYNKP